MYMLYNTISNTRLISCCTYINHVWVHKTYTFSQKKLAQILFYSSSTR